MSYILGCSLLCISCKLQNWFLNLNLGSVQPMSSPSVLVKSLFLALVMVLMDLSQSISLLLSILMTLEAVVEKLGGFLNPYLEDILDLIVLHREYALELDVKIQARAANIRRLLIEKIPVRLMLPPLLQLYTRAAQCGEASLSLTFQMLGGLIGVMDRPSIVTYHVKIFEQCLVALDLRRLLPESVKDINVVEQSVIHAITGLSCENIPIMCRNIWPLVVISRFQLWFENDLVLIPRETAWFGYYPDGAFSPVLPPQQTKSDGSHSEIEGAASASYTLTCDDQM